MIAVSLFTNLALSAELQECSGSLGAPDGQSYEVKGFGTDEAEARQSAVLSARLLGAQSVLTKGIQAWIAGTPEAQVAIGTTLVEGTPLLGIPGWTWTDGACTTQTVDDANSYTATWNVGSEEIRRPTPSLSLDASRRRACVPMYQRNLMQVIDEVLRSPSALPKLSQLDGAFATLAGCWTSDVPTVSPSTQAFSPSGPARCSAIDGTGKAIAVGFGTTAEHAAEHATRQGILTRTYRTLGVLASSYVDPPSEDRAAKFEPTLRGLVGLSGPSDRVDRSRLACATVTQSPLVWIGRDAHVKACNAASWTERPKETIAAADASAFLDGTCTLQVSPNFEIVRFASRSAKEERKASLVAGAYKVAGDCATTCYSRATWGTEEAQHTLDGAPDRSSKKAVLQSLKPLLAGQSLAGLELLPTLQDPTALGALLSGETSKKLKAELRSLPTQDERWTSIDGNWILLP